MLTLNKPVCVGFSILELNKLLMYKFHYYYVCNKYDAKLLFTDTGSLVYEINSRDVYEQCFKDKGLFDFSGYPTNSSIMIVQIKKFFFTKTLLNIIQNLFPMKHLLVMIEIRLG